MNKSMCSKNLVQSNMETKEVKPTHVDIDLEKRIFGGWFSNQ